MAQASHLKKSKAARENELESRQFITVDNASKASSASLFRQLRCARNKTSSNESALARTFSSETLVQSAITIRYFEYKQRTTSSVFQIAITIEAQQQQLSPVTVKVTESETGSCDGGMRLLDTVSLCCSIVNCSGKENGNKATSEKGSVQAHNERIQQKLRIK